MSNYKPKTLNDDGTMIRTGMVRLSYPHLFEKYKKSDKYQCQLIIPKEDKATVTAIKGAIDAAKKNGKTSRWSGKIPGNLRNPLNDADAMEETPEEFAGCYLINAKTNRRPDVYDVPSGAKGRPDELYDEDEIYAGCYVRASITAYPYDNSGAGVAFLLNWVQKLEDGERFGGGSVTKDSDFDDDAEDDDLLG